MNDRPLFDLPPGDRPKVKRRAKRPALPPVAVPSKPPPEVWTIRFTAAPDQVPPIIRCRRFLKLAWRCYRLKARIVAGPGTIAPVGDSAANRTGKNAVVAGTTGRMER